MRHPLGHWRTLCDPVCGNSTTSFGAPSREAPNSASGPPPPPHRRRWATRPLGAVRSIACRGGSDRRGATVPPHGAYRAAPGIGRPERPPRRAPPHRRSLVRPSVHIRALAT